MDVFSEMAFARHDSAVKHMNLQLLRQNIQDLYNVKLGKRRKNPNRQRCSLFCSRIQPLIASYAPGDGAVIPTQRAIKLKETKKRQPVWF